MTPYRMKMWDDSGRTMIEDKDEDPRELVQRMTRKFNEKML